MEGGSRTYSPWFVLSGVRHTTFVVLFEAFGKIVRQPRVVPARIVLALQNVDVCIALHVACAGAVRSAIGKPGVVLFRGAQKNYAGAGFALRCAAVEAWWRRRESNPRPQ